MFMAAQTWFLVSKDVWYVDGGCASHVARDGSLLTFLGNSVRTKVKLGNGEVVQAVLRGTISISNSNGPKLIDDELLIPDLNQNLLCVAQLLKKGYSLSFKNHSCIILDSNDYEVIRVEMHEIVFHYIGIM